MIVTELYHGQGLGNQLWSYVATRVLGVDLGYSFGIMSAHKFKGHEFLDLDFGEKVIGGKGPEGGPPELLPEGVHHYFREKEMWYTRFECDVRGLDQDLLKIGDNTKIEGYFQSEELIRHHRKEIKKWLKVKPEFDNYEFSKDDICVLNVRGGEYKGIPYLILEKNYWINAMENMRKINPSMKFVVVDDVPYAKSLLPELTVTHVSIGDDFSIIKNAHYLILSNSSFAFFPAWINENLKMAIAPKYWARHNVSDGYWACEFNIYDDWQWQDRKGNLFSAEQCRSEYESYKKKKKIQNLKPKSKSYFSKIIFKVIIKFKRIKKRIFEGSNET